MHQRGRENPAQMEGRRRVVNTLAQSWVGWGEKREQVEEN